MDSARPRPLDPAELEVTPGPPVERSELPRVRIVILNWNGRHHLEPCFETLAALEYPAERVEVVLVDNGSDDGSVEYVRRRHSDVRLLANERNVGFSAGCNQGARAPGRPEVLCFLNNDMRVEPAFLRELVAPIARGECTATTGKMLSWDGKLVNGAGGGMNFHGIGIQRGYLEPPGPQFDVPRRTLFACGGAMAMEAAEFERVGGFDEAFFAYYEDVDLGWRTWLAGGSVHYVPSAVCYHHHSSTSRRLPIETLRLLQARNPVLACFKNYDTPNLRRLFGPILALSLRRAFLVAGLEDDAPFRVEQARLAGAGPLARLLRRAEKGIERTIPLRRLAAADLVGLNDLLGNFSEWRKRRRAVQRLRRRPDEEILRLFLKPLWCVEQDAGFRDLFDGLTDLFGLDELFDGCVEPGAEPRT